MPFPQQRFEHTPVSPSSNFRDITRGQTTVWIKKRKLHLLFYLMKITLQSDIQATEGLIIHTLSWQQDGYWFTINIYEQSQPQHDVPTSQTNQH